MLRSGPGLQAARLGEGKALGRVPSTQQNGAVGSGDTQPGPQPGPQPKQSSLSAWSLKLPSLSSGGHRQTLSTPVPDIEPRSRPAKRLWPAQPSDQDGWT